MGFRNANLAMLYHKLQLDIFIISYRGYGNSQGIPNEQGIKMDGIAAYQYMITQLNIVPDQIIIFGRSLGGAVAIHVAGTIEKDQAQPKALIIENTFTNISSMVDHMFPFLKPIKSYVLKLNWNSIETIQHITSPILFIAGELDEIVPHKQMISLYHAANESEYKQMTTYANGKHNDTWQKGGTHYIKIIQQFISSYFDTYDQLFQINVPQMMELLNQNQNL